MRVTKKSALFYTLIPRAKSKIAPGMIEDFVDTVQFAVIDMYEEFYAKTIWLVFVLTGKPANLCILASNFRPHLILRTIPNDHLSVTVAVNSVIRCKIAQKYHMNNAKLNDSITSKILLSMLIIYYKRTSCRRPMEIIQNNHHNNRCHHSNNSSI